jgi:hypothetical protein
MVGKKYEEIEETHTVRIYSVAEHKPRHAASHSHFKLR